MAPQICGHWFSMVFLQWVFIPTGFWCDGISPRVRAERVGNAPNIWRLTSVSIFENIWNTYMNNIYEHIYIYIWKILSIPSFVFQTQQCFSSTAKLTCEDMSISSAVTRPRFGNYCRPWNGHMICIDLWIDRTFINTLYNRCIVEDALPPALLASLLHTDIETCL